METALKSARAQPRSDQVAPLLAEYLARHIPEELHHDEWTLEDLEVLGRHRTEVLKRLPSPTTAAMVGAQYYLVLHVHPVALMGYLAVLEGEPPSVEDVEAVIAITGLPREAFRTYLEHARLDFNHRDDLDDMLDRMPLTRDQVELIAISAFQTIHWVRALFEEMVELHRSESGVTAPA